MSSTWLSRIPSGDGMPLLCFPHAGGRASAFQSWADELPTTLRPMPLDYPRCKADGAAFASVGEIAEDAMRSLKELLRTPVVLFGHSLGALVAYELAHLLCAARRPPVLLIVSGHRAPGEPFCEPPIHHLPSAQLQQQIRSWGGVPQQVADDPATFDHFESRIREDLRLAETWEPTRARLLCTVVAYSGVRDGLATPRSMVGWGTVTRAEFRHTVLPGGHFFLQEQRQQLLSSLLVEVERCAG